MLVSYRYRGRFVTLLEAQMSEILKGLSNRQGRVATILTSLAARQTGFTYESVRALICQGLDRTPHPACGSPGRDPKTGQEEGELKIKRRADSRASRDALRALPRVGLPVASRPRLSSADTGCFR